MSPNYFTLLAVAPARGRSLNTLPADETSVAMLSHTIAESLFGPASDPLGQTIELNTVHLTVVGVMPPGFRGLSDAADIWVPMAQAAQLMFARRLVVPFAFWHQVLLQIPSGMSSQELASILQSASQGTSEQFNIPSVFAGATMRTRAIELGEHRRDRDLESSLVVLFAAVGLVLLVACANLANLLLVRAAHREREISLRASIGAGGFRIFRQLLTEAAVLGLLGAGLALCLAKGGIEIVEALKPPAIAGSSSSEPMQVNLSVLGFTLGLSLLATLLFGIAPALRACRSDLIQALRGQTSGPAHSSGYLRSGLVVAEIALATVLLVGAGLLLQSLGNLLGQQVGFAQDFLAARIDLPSKAYSESQSRLFYEELLAKARSLLGVESASLANCLPIESGCDRTSLRIAGDPSETGNPYSTWVQMIDENFLSDLKIPLLAGRGVNAEDRAGAPLIAVVNQKAASEYWPDRNPLGERIRPAIGFPEGQFAEIISERPADHSTESVEWLEIPRIEGLAQRQRPAFENFLSDLKIPLLAGRGVNAEDRAGAPLIAVVNQKAASEYWPDRNPLGERIRPAIGFPEGQFAEVVGVVGNTKDRGLGAKATAGIYLSFRQISYRSNFLFLKGSQPAQLAGPLRTLVQEIDPRLAMWDTRPLGEFVGQSAAQSRFRALLLGSFAGLALVLSLIGIYGVTSFAVAMRSRELAIRKAFGARRRQLLQMVLWHGMSLVGLGILVGLAGSLGLTRFLTSMLFGISAGDGWTLLITLLLITLTSLAACYIPARRATQLDPIDCLRCD